jgi:hypothetical protein
MLSGMEHIEFASRDPLLKPICNVCGSPTRLVGLEGHPERERTDMCTYQCIACGEVQTRDLARVPFQRRGGR